MIHHALTGQEIVIELKTTKEGLSEEQAKKRLEDFGPNTLPKAGRESSRFTIFLSQWKSPLIIILVIAGTISAFLHEYIDMGIIYTTVLINVLIGFFQEYKANEALKKLQSMITYKAVVLRNKKKVQIDSTNIVPGDVLVISPGDNIQADGRLLLVNTLQVNEAALTGESEPVQKSTDVLGDDTSLADRVNMVFRGTTVSDGEGLAVVTNTGADTQIGQIATLVNDTSEDHTPLQVQLGKLSKWLGIVVMGLAVLLILVGLFAGRDAYTIYELFETAVAVAVAAIPEGLVISLTAILAVGMQHIVKKKALVRRLVAAETLGSVSVICTDKTGTLTEGIMRVARLITKQEDLPKAELDVLDAHDKKRHQDALFAIKIGMLCNNASLQNPKDEPQHWTFLGDTTEASLLDIGERIGFHKDSLDDVYERLDDIPFSSERKYMATLHHGTHGQFLAVKGAPEVILEKCTRIYENAETKRLSTAAKKTLKKQIDELSSEGLRVLAVAHKNMPLRTQKVNEKDITSLSFIGFVGIRDPLRRDVKQTIDIAKAAGIHVAMITGDHKRTAAAIAKMLGLPHSDKDILEGAEIDALSKAQLKKAIREASIFARVDPKHKVAIVQAFQARGDVVAMTGDGINDAPALKGADIGVALGSGTDVAKETSDIVLLDDSFSTIVAAVEQGRTIYQNIKKIILYLISGTFAEVALIIGSIIAGLPMAALPVQILWNNILEDTFLNIALIFDNGDKDNMKDPPRSKGESLIDKEMKVFIVAKSVLSNVILFSIYYTVLSRTGDLQLARTMVFVGFGIDALFLVFSVRSLRHMIWQMNPFNNKPLLWAVGYSWIMLIAAVHFPPIQYLLQTTALGIREWSVMLAFGIGNILLLETVKWIFIARKKHHT